MKIVFAAVALFTISLAGSASADTGMKMSHISFKATSDLGQATITYHITPANRSADVGMQIFAHRDDLAGKPGEWETLTPQVAGAPQIFSLYRRLDNTGSFTLDLNKGTYGAARVILFESPDAKTINFSNTLYDSTNDPNHPAINLNLNIKTSTHRVTSPTLTVADTQQIDDNGDGTYNVTIPAVVKVPLGYTAGDNGLWAMAKGTGGFAQVWAGLGDAVPGGDPDDNFLKIPIKFVMKKNKPGLASLQFGLFKASWGDPLEWVYPGTDYEVGGDAWVVRASADAIPPRLKVDAGKFETMDGKPYDFYADNPAGKGAVSFIRGGNYGNAISWTSSPALNRPGYFILLNDLGLKYVRFNFNPDRYLTQPMYRHIVDQAVQNIWAAGLYPLIAPQDLPMGSSQGERADKGVQVVKAMAEQYKGKSIWLEICNEPHEFESWADWKPVAERMVKVVRDVDPGAFVVVPFEGYSKDGRAAAKDPIKDVHVDLYDGHAYVDPAQVETLYGPAVTAGLPVLIGEYGGGADYMSHMDAALQKLPAGLMAAGPWAFTIAGQDSLPLVESGDTATLKLTPAGQAIAKDYAAWNSGKMVSDTANP